MQPILIGSPLTVLLSAWGSWPRLQIQFPQPPFTWTFLKLELLYPLWTSPDGHSATGQFYSHIYSLRHPLAQWPSWPSHAAGVLASSAEAHSGQDRGLGPWKQSRGSCPTTKERMEQSLLWMGCTFVKADWATERNIPEDSPSAHNFSPHVPCPVSFHNQ